MLSLVVLTYIVIVSNYLIYRSILKILSSNTEFYFVLKSPSRPDKDFLNSTTLSLIKFHPIQTKYLSFTLFKRPPNSVF